MTGPKNVTKLFFEFVRRSDTSKRPTFPVRGSSLPTRSIPSSVGIFLFITMLTPPVGPTQALNGRIPKVKRWELMRLRMCGVTTILLHTSSWQG